MAYNKGFSPEMVPGKGCAIFMSAESPSQKEQNGTSLSLIAPSSQKLLGSRQIFKF